MTASFYERLSEPLAGRHCRAPGLAQVGQHLGDLLRQGDGAFASQVDDLLGHAELDVLRGKLQQLGAMLPVPAKLERTADLRYITPDRDSCLHGQRRELLDPAAMPHRDVSDLLPTLYQ